MSHTMSWHLASDVEGGGGGVTSPESKGNTNTASC